MTRPKIAIVLFNLGAPDSPAAVRPFLMNLFADPAILRVPFFIRPLLARLIALARVKPASDNYALLGGKSPLLELTQAQARALEAALPELEARCFIAMRYWHPFSEAVARAVRAWDPDEVVLLPLYPQYSTTTTGSSIDRMARGSGAALGWSSRSATLCCYHSDGGYRGLRSLRIVREKLRRRAEPLDAGVKLRVLFSAHGLPEVIVKRGDPYQYPDRTYRRRGDVQRLGIAGP